MNAEPEGSRCRTTGYAGVRVSGQTAFFYKLTTKKTKDAFVRLTMHFPQEHQSIQTPIVRKRAMMVVFMLFCFFAIGTAMPVFAQTQLPGQLDSSEKLLGGGSQQFDLSTSTGLSGNDIRVTIGRIINVFLGTLGVIALVLLLYAGFLWMTAAGNDDKIETAKKILLNAGIGLAIVLSAYGITYFVISRLIGATTTNGGTQGDIFGSDGNGSGALGSGIIEDHYPPRNGRGIPRNTKIIITFKEAMRRSTLIDDKGTPNNPDDDVVNAANVRVHKTIQPNDALAILRAVSKDDKTFVFFLPPGVLFGSPSEAMSYKVLLTNGIKRGDGSDAFSGRFGTKYEWQFEVSTVVDIEPPTVVSVLPIANKTYPRNVVIQVNFSEPIDPTIVSGIVSGDSAKRQSVVDVQRGDTNETVEGVVRVSNQYSTITFVTNVKCGTNSCGQDVFCLPSLKTIKTILPTATLEATTDAPFATKVPLDGIADIAGNALDGNPARDVVTNKRIPLGPPGDDYTWEFTTSDEIDLTPPLIVSTIPAHGAADVSTTEPLIVTFSKPLWATTWNRASVLLNTAGVQVGITPKLNQTDFSIGIIEHDPFAATKEYIPVITSQVQDGNQNCYYPCAGPGCQGATWAKPPYPSCPATRTP